MKIRTLLFIVPLVALIFSCAKTTRNSSDDTAFSSSRQRFDLLELGDERTRRKPTVQFEASGVLFAPPKNSELVSENEKNTILEQTGYAAGILTVDDLFFDRTTGVTCIVSHIPTETNLLDDFLDGMRSGKTPDQYSENYFILNGRKMIQFRMLIQNNFLLRVVYEAHNGAYAVFDYTFPTADAQTSLNTIAESLDSIVFISS